MGNINYLKAANAILQALIASLFWWRLATDETGLDGRRTAVLYGATTMGLFYPLYQGLIWLTEAALLAKEMKSGYYRLSSWFIAKRLVEIPLQWIPPVMYVIVAYWLIGLRPSAWRYIVHIGALALCSSVTASLGLLIPATITTPGAGEMFMWTSMVLVYMVEGFWIPLSEWPPWTRWLHWISYTFYTDEILCRIEFSGAKFAVVPNASSHYIRNLNYSDPTLRYVTGEQVLAQNQLNGPIWRDIVFMVGLFLFCNIATYIVLRIRLSTRK